MKTRQVGICEGCGMEFDDLAAGHKHEQHCDKMVTVYSVDIEFNAGYSADLTIDIDRQVYSPERAKSLALGIPNVGKGSAGMYWHQCTLDEAEIPAIEAKLRQMAHDDIARYADEVLTKKALRYFGD